MEQARARRPGPSLAATLLLGLLGLLGVLACGGASDDEAQIELLVVDYNILHGISASADDPPYERFPERIRLIADALAELQPDVIFLQEVVPMGEEDYGDTRAILLEALGDEYTAVFGDITGGPIDSGALGQMTLTRLPVLSSENRHVGGPRSVHRVTVDTEIGPVDLYNTHLEGTGAVLDVSADAPVEEIEDVLAFIQETHGGGPALLAGDFNAEPGDPSIARVLAAGFIDALAAGGDATCEVAGDPGCTSSTRPLYDNAENLTDHRIDYIFASPGEGGAVDVSRARLFLNEPVAVDGGLLWPSDHIGVEATIRLTGARYRVKQTGPVG